MAQPQRFEELVVRYQGVVCAVAYAVLRDRARSEEIAQEAFLIAWQKLPALEPPPAMPGWICGIARNLAANAARRRKETAMEHAPEPMSDGTPLDRVLDREADELAARALASLRDGDREAIVLYYRGDGAVADVATTLGITESAARQRLHRGRERLKAALGAVETTLRATKPGPAFTTACVAALAATAGNAEAATPKAAPATAKTGLVSLAAVASLVGIVAIAQATSSSQSPPADVQAIRAPAPSLSLSTPSSLSTPPATTALVQPPAAAGFRTLDDRGKATLVDKIRSARVARIAASPTPAPAGAPATVKVYDFSGDTLDATPPPPPPKDLSILGKATLRYAIRSVQPLLLECYGAAYDRLEPKTGTLAVKVRLTSEPGIATVVETAELSGDAHLLADAELAECMRETLLSIELPAMAEGGDVDVHYPFQMSGRRP